MRFLFLLIISISTPSCVSMTSPQLGMSEKAWLRTTLVGDLALKEEGLTVCRSGGAFYYFKQGALVRIDQGQAMPHTLNVNLKTS